MGTSENIPTTETGIGRLHAPLLTVGLIVTVITIVLQAIEHLVDVEMTLAIVPAAMMAGIAIAVGLTRQRAMTRQLKVALGESGRLAAAYKESENRFRQLAENIQEVFWVADPATHKIIYISPAYEAIWGKSCRELYENPLAFVEGIHPDDRAHVQTALREQERTGCFEANYRVVRPDGSIRWIWDRGFPVKDDDGNLLRVVGIAQDITRIKQAEAVERERTSLKDAVVAMERVLGAVGHELRTPLAGLRAMSELLLTDSLPPADSERFIQSIHDESVRMSDTVNDLVEAARLNSGRAQWNWTEFSLKSVCAEAVDRCKRFMNAQVAIECDVEPEALRMRGDREAICRLIVSLVGNSMKFTRQGRIQVRIGRDAQPAKVRLEVCDTGAGIPAEIAPRLGDAFVMNSGSLGHNYVHGTGLGLAIGKGIAAAHGGEILVQSTVGQGTRVTAVLDGGLDGPIAAEGKLVFAGPLETGK